MFYCFIPQETKIAPENGWLQDYFPFEMVPFQVTFVHFWGLVILLVTKITQMIYQVITNTNYYQVFRGEPCLSQNNYPPEV